MENGKWTKKKTQKQTNKKEMKENTTQKSNSQDILMCVMWENGWKWKMENYIVIPTRDHHIIWPGQHRDIIKPKTSKQSPCRKDNVCLCIIIIFFFCGWDIKKQKRVDYYNVDTHTHAHNPPKQPPVSFILPTSIMYMLVMFICFCIYVYKFNVNKWSSHPTMWYPWTHWIPRISF